MGWKASLQTHAISPLAVSVARLVSNDQEGASNSACYHFSVLSDVGCEGSEVLKLRELRVNRSLRRVEQKQRRPPDGVHYIADVLILHQGLEPLAERAQYGNAKVGVGRRGDLLQLAAVLN